MSSSHALAPSLVRPSTRTASVAADLVLVTAGVVVMSALAQVSVPLPHTPVPLTGQTLGVLLTGAALGSARGTLSLGCYLLVGALGAPVFAGQASGWDVLRLSSATGGYLIGMLVAAALVGRLADRELDRRTWTALATMAAGNVVIYAFGMLWLAHALGVGLDQAWTLGVRPFIPGDVVKIVLAACLLPLAWRLSVRVSGGHA